MSSRGAAPSPDVTHSVRPPPPQVYSKRFLVAHKHLEYAVVEKVVMSRLVHPYIVSLRYAFQTPSRLFLLSDYCAGGELFNTLRKHGLLLENAARVYLAQLVLALQYMHEEGVVHRDLKVRARRDCAITPLPVPLSHHHHPPA